MLNKNQYFNLINAANVASGVCGNNFVDNYKKFREFEICSLGIPMLISADSSIFEFSEDDFFEIDPLDVCKVVYGHANTSYTGFLHAFKTFRFLSKVKVKSEFVDTYNSIINQNLSCRAYVQKLKTGGKQIGAFQTRNIPHFGHEAIIKKMLDQCDHLVINPVIGPKKSGDVTLGALEKVFKDLAARKYKNNISFFPIISNMFYAGPYEALHHSLLRQSLGFDLFSVGRDHAGADGIYGPYDALKFIEKVQDSLRINVMCHNGAVYCSKCDEVLLSGDCNCGYEYAQDISGTDFRNSLRQGNIFLHADKDMQMLIVSKAMELIEK